MPLRTLLERLDPPPPPEVLDAGRALRHRDFIVVCLIVDAPRTFPDTWIYVHHPTVLVGRIQNFRNWSAAMVPDPAARAWAWSTSARRATPCGAGPTPNCLIWRPASCTLLGVTPGARIEDGCVIRQQYAYPVYDDGYLANVETIRDYLARFENLQTIGRSGMHRYNNQDHSMLTGQLAARNVLGERHDVWQVNTDGSYGEGPPVDE